MARVTYYVTQPFHRDPENDRIYPGLAAEAPTKHAAERALQTKKPSVVGVIAFSRSGDPEQGDWEDAIVIGISGKIVDQAMEESLPW